MGVSGGSIPTLVVFSPSLSCCCFGVAKLSKSVLEVGVDGDGEEGVLGELKVMRGIEVGVDGAVSKEPEEGRGMRCGAFSRMIVDSSVGSSSDSCSWSTTIGGIGDSSGVSTT